MRKAYHSPAWPALRLRVLARDGYRCRWCGGPANEADHVVALAEGGAALDPANLGRQLQALQHGTRPARSIAAREDRPPIAPMVAAYLAAIVAANLLVAAFGPVWSIVNAAVFVGLDLTARDVLDLRWHGRWLPMLALIATGGVLSWLLNAGAGQIAIASTVAFLAASLVDLAVFRLLGDRTRWQRVNGSNVAGAAVDSVVFPLLAFGWPPLLLVMLAQFAAKVAGGAVWYELIHALSVRRRTA